MSAAPRSRATTIVLALSLLAGAGLALVRHEIARYARSAWVRHERQLVSVVVPPGASADDVAHLLEDRGVIGDARLFSRWLRLVSHKAHKLQAGTYELSPGMSPEQIVDIIASGRLQEVRVTIPEGLDKTAVARRLADAGLSTHEALMSAMDDADIIASFGVPTTGAGGQDGVPGGVEGYLFPDTYRFAANATPQQILWRMRNRLDEVLDARIQDRMRARGLDLHTVLTLASLVEEETGAGHERPRIAGVFFNRMRKKMKLQTDPTAVYGVAGHDGSISRSDLQRVHAYNTYVIPGLPPGPIAQPGLASIKAVLWPITTDDLFFVARGASGEHEFCPTLECHNDAIRRWQTASDAEQPSSEQPSSEQPSSEQPSSEQPRRADASTGDGDRDGNGALDAESQRAGSPPTADTGAPNNAAAADVAGHVAAGDDAAPAARP